MSAKTLVQMWMRSCILAMTHSRVPSRAYKDEHETFQICRALLWIMTAFWQIGRSLLRSLFLSWEYLCLITFFLCVHSFVTFLRASFSTAKDMTQFVTHYFMTLITHFLVRFMPSRTFYSWCLTVFIMNWLIIIPLQLVSHRVPTLHLLFHSVHFLILCFYILNSCSDSYGTCRVSTCVVHFGRHRIWGLFCQTWGFLGMTH